MGFSLAIYPWVYKAQLEEDGTWREEFEEKPHLTPEAEAALPEKELQTLLAKRNSFPDMPLVNYTTQYGMGCFEGLKAYPQPDGSLKVFRPDQNGARMHRSMKGLMMPAFPEALFVPAVKEMVERNRKIGFAPQYDPAWKNNHFLDGHAIYLRPFSYSEPAIGLGISKYPRVIIIGTPVSSYFSASNSRAVTTNKIRATPNGTGWIKCDANYVIATLAKKEAEAAGYMEAIFLDSREGKYLEEGSSCNIFILTKEGTLVTPALGDTILPGITRESILKLAQSKGLKTEERKISIEEALDNGKEAFVTGTAAGITFIESITHKDRTAVYNHGKIGDVTMDLLKTLKGIQYGSLEDKFGWMV